MSESVLYRLTEVTKNYRKGPQTISVLDALSLTIGRGEFVALMGPSGSGKTTLLNLLGGIDRPSSGAISFQGEPLEKMSERALSRWRRQNVGFVFQSYNLMPMLSAAQNVELPLLLAPLSARQRRENVRTALQLVGLEERAKHKPRELSGGQQQRVAIARALVADPKVILADEPTGDLDRETANEILGLFQMLNQQVGTALVMVTHDPEAARFARRTLRMDKGAVVGSRLAA